MALLARANANAALLTNNCLLLKLTSHDMMLRSIATCINKFSIPKEVSKCTCLIRPFEQCNITPDSHKNFVRKCHIKPHNKNYVPFDEVLKRRTEEASRSIIVQVNSAQSHGELFTYCEKFGTVNSMHHYFLKGVIPELEVDYRHFFLVEFKNCESANTVINTANYPTDEGIVPVSSKMLWFRNLKKVQGISSDKNLKNPIHTPSITNNLPIHEKLSIEQILVNASTISEQMVAIHEACQLDEIDVRLRFLTAFQLQESFAGLSPHMTVYPFGSSVNGFGKHGCDLDLALSLEDFTPEPSSSRLVFQTKSTTNNANAQSRIFLGAIADLMQYFVPGVTKVKRILQARVPIIKYYQSLTGLECDLSITNMSAVYMSELLSLYGEIDWRVRPLVFTIREWANRQSITRSSPGPWITNFSLTLVVMFYLQQKKILPSLDQLKNLAGKDDSRRMKASVDCTFLRDITKLPTETINKNTESLENLLYDFFVFFSTFDFALHGLCLRRGDKIMKPHESSLFIENPLEPWMNVSKNVKPQEIQRIITLARAAADVLEMTADETPACTILTIFDERAIASVKKMRNKKKVDVKALFEMSDDESTPDMKNKKNRKRRKN